MVQCPLGWVRSIDVAGICLYMYIMYVFIMYIHVNLNVTYQPFQHCSYCACIN